MFSKFDLSKTVNVYVSVLKTMFYSKQDRKPFSDGDLWAIYSWNQLQWLLRNFHHFVFTLDEYQHKWLSSILSKQWAQPRPLFLAAVAHDVEQVVHSVVVWSCIRMCECTLQQHALCDVDKTGEAPYKYPPYIIIISFKWANMFLNCLCTLRIVHLTFPDKRLLIFWQDVRTNGIQREH